MEKIRWPIIVTLAALQGCGVDLRAAVIPRTDAEATAVAVRTVLAERDALLTAAAIQRLERLADTAGASPEIIYAPPVRK